MSTNIKGVSKKLMTVLVAAMVFFSVFSVLSIGGDSRVYATGETGVVTASKLNIRSGAGTNYSKIGSLAKGKTFTVLGSAKDKSGVTWYKIKYNSKNGYVSSKYVNIKKPTVTSISNLKGTVNTKKDPLIVRSGPGSSYNKLGSMAKGKTFNITGKSTDSSGVTWYRLTFNGKTGYVSSLYVKTSSTSSGSSGSSSSDVTGSKGTVSTKSDPLIVRSGPGSKYSKIGSMAKGKTFTITGQTTDSLGVVWYKLTYNGKTGYVSSAYVKVTGSSSGSSGSSGSDVTGSKGTVNTKNDPLIVRSGAGASYSRIGSLAKGKTFTITGQATDSSGVIWYKLTYNGKTGYVSSVYVKVTENSGSSGDSGSDETTGPITFQLGTVTTSSSPLNVRSGPGTSYSKLGTLAKGSSVTITGSSKDKNGKVWYKYQFSSKQAGYICSDYVKVQTVNSDSEFEAYMTAQGFPESYKPGLRALHAAYPNWTFKAVNVGCSWSQALSAETKNLGTNLVSSSSPVSYRSTASGSYNSSTGAWTKFDGNWYAASSQVVAYYMDPRNFLNDNGIYQFMTHKYDSSTQNTNTVAAVVKGTFMETRKPGGGYSSFASLINDAGKAANVNPNVLAAMIVQEQGTKGTSGLISGNYGSYKGYYNFFNVGAYTTASRNKIEQGLWYASQSGSYSRPWNSVYKSIKGGAEFYSSQYVSKNQDTYYTKKFNVKNGVSNIGKHQYMTNVAGALSEGSIVKKAFTGNSSYAATFEIPVYTNMPSTPCVLP